VNENECCAVDGSVNLSDVNGDQTRTIHGCWMRVMIARCDDRGEDTVHVAVTGDKYLFTYSKYCVY
jgi:hypothetical protein